MNVQVAAMVCAGALLTGCAEGSPDVGSAAPSTSATAHATADATADATDELSRTAPIYAAVIRELVLGANGTAPDATPYKRVWVVDHAVLNAAQPDGADKAGEPFSEALKTALQGELPDLPPVGFVSDPGEVLVSDGPPATPLRDHIRGHGTVIVLGPIEAHGDRVHVGHEAWCAAHCAEWFTSVLHQRDDSWVVTGETGPHAIT